MSFPFLDVTETKDVNTTSNLEIFKEIAWDFENNIPIFKDGKEVIVYKNRAIKVWIWKALKTERYKYLCYSWDFGQEIESLIGASMSSEATKTEIKRYITECLLCNPYIESVTDMEIEIVGSGVKGNITVNTIYGEVEADV